MVKTVETCPSTWFSLTLMSTIDVKMGEVSVYCSNSCTVTDFLNVFLLLIY